MPPVIAEQLWTQSSGHPFLAQYLYHHLWLRHQQVAVDASTIDDLVRQYYSERSKDVEGWVNGVEVAGLTAYSALDERGQWMTEEVVAAQLSHSAQMTKRGLLALCYHGLAGHENWQHYRRAGALFQT